MRNRLETLTFETETIQEIDVFVAPVDAKPGIPIREPQHRPIPEIPNPIKPRVPETVPTISPSTPAEKPSPKAPVPA